MCETQRLTPALESAMEGNLTAFLRRLDSLELDGEEDVFGKEFQNMRGGAGTEGLSVETGRQRENVKKNRYKDILPFDQTRVPLSLLAEDGYGDYINANFIQGTGDSPYYIATQGPLTNTVVDLWRMVWEYRVTVVVMACREVEEGKRKCERYWGMNQEPVEFGPFTVTNMGEESLGVEVIMRTLSVTLHGEVRTVRQFQYLAWPDHGIPGNVDGLLGMVERIHQETGTQRERESERGPVCVHCSAGCGRTGVICTVDYVWNLLKNKRVGEGFSVSAVVQEIRRQRPAAVQTKDQYRFVYCIVGEMFQRELQAPTSLYINWQQESQTTQREGGVKGQHVERKPVPLPKSKSLPLSLQTQGVMADTYAVVSRPPLAPSLDTSSYENLPSLPRPPPLLSSPPSLLAPPPPLQPKPRARPPNTPTLNYTTLSFPSPTTRNAGKTGRGEGEDWAPTLPQRTVDSYMVEDQSLSRESSFSSYDGTPSGKIHSALKMGFSGSPAEKKVPEATESFDDAYEDITDIVKTPGLGYNRRVKKPTGPRDPPIEWSLHER